MRDLALRLALLAGSIVISLCAAELVLRAFFPARNVGPSFTVYDSEYGKRLKRNASLLRITPEFTMRLTTNSLGFRGPEPGALPAHAILFLGDSFTMGYGVNDGEEFPAIVQKALAARQPPVPVVNTGMGDNGNGRWVKFLRREAQRFEPRAVILQVQDNDFEDNPREALFSLSKSGELVEQPIPGPGWARISQEGIERVPGLPYSQLLARLRQGVAPIWPTAASDPSSSPAEETVDPLTLRLIDESLAICAAHGWPAIGVLADLRESRRKAVEAIFAARGDRLILVPGKTARPDLYYRVDGHWNAAGHGVAARLILEELDRMQITAPE